MSEGMHIHIVDNKQVSYPNDTCPICNPEQAQPTAQAIPNVHRKGDTIVVQVSRGIMSTTTWYGKGNCFLHSLRRMRKDAQNKVMLDNTGKPLWEQLTMRINVPLFRGYTTEMFKLIKEISEAKYRQETQTTQATPQQPVTKQLPTVDIVTNAFPADLAEMLLIEDTPQYITIRPRQYLGSANFAKIASIIRDQFNGEYISAGQESHFRIPKLAGETVPQRG